MRADDTLAFPDYLWVSKNHFQRDWVLRRTYRRIKNVIVIMEWNPLSAVKDMFKQASVNLSIPEYDTPVRRCFEMFDLNKAGRLTKEQLKKVNIISFEFYEYSIEQTIIK